MRQLFGIVKGLALGGVCGFALYKALAGHVESTTAGAEDRLRRASQQLEDRGRQTTTSRFQPAVDGPATLDYKRRWNTAVQSLQSLLVEGDGPQERLKPVRQLRDGAQDVATRVYKQMQDGIQIQELSPEESRSDNTSA
eukprot:m.192809 g.192809  ORF g.192809 m.192809 type:complete len:139 (-) comp16969_c0_seq5:2731-3147(-)